MALNVLIKLADNLDRDGQTDYVKNIEKAIDKLCKGERKQVMDYLIKAADFFDSNGMGRYAEAVDLTIHKLANTSELDFKKKQLEMRMVDLRNKMNEATGPEKEALRKELRGLESGFQTMQKTLKSLKPGMERASETPKQRYTRMMKPEKGMIQSKPTSPDYMISKDNFTAPLRDVFKIRRLIRQIAVGTELLPTKYGRTIKASGPFSWPIYWVLHSLRNKVNLPKGWQVAFDKRNKELKEEDADAMLRHIEDQLGAVLRERQMPQAMRHVVREREEGPEQERGKVRLY